MNKIFKSAQLVAFFSLTLFLSGCVQTQALYIGNKVTAEKVALEKDSRQVGLWETFDLKISYDFVVKDQLFKISGQTELGDHQKMVYDHVRSLDIYIFFLDQDSRVLLTEPLQRSFRISTQRKMSYSRSYRVPDGTVAVSFGYSGQVAEREGHMRFDLLPLSD